MKKCILILLLLLIISMVSLRIIKGYFPLPMWVRHISNLLVVQKDLYEPIITDDFLFYQKGFSKVYLLKAKYLENYQIGFFVKNNNISSKYKFKGKIKAEFFYKDKLLFDNTITSIKSAFYARDDINYYREVSLMNFKIPLMGKYKDNISVKLTVLEPDNELEKYGNSIKLYIGVSAIP